MGAEDNNLKDDHTINGAWRRRECQFMETLNRDSSHQDKVNPPARPDDVRQKQEISL